MAKPINALAVAVALSAFAITAARAELQTQEIDYQVGDQTFRGYLAYDDAVAGKRPGILVVHEFWGHNAHARTRAEMLAKIGYTAFALDMYGKGKVADHPDTARAFATALKDDPESIRARFDAAKGLLQQQSTVDAQQIAAIGFCMGGTIVLDMVRQGADLDGVVSYHGGLATKTPAEPGKTKAQVMVFTGGADPLIPVEQVQAFVGEMQSAAVEYTLKAYPGVKHAFTNPAADTARETFAMAAVGYDKAADEDSWRLTQLFLKDIFAADRGR